MYWMSYDTLKQGWVNYWLVGYLMGYVDNMCGLMSIENEALQQNVSLKPHRIELFIETTLETLTQWMKYSCLWPLYYQ